MRLFEQFEPKGPGSWLVNPNPAKPWKRFQTPGRSVWKQKKHRVERRRARLDPETQPLYRKYRGWEF
jgi:hypothetical protein